MLVLALSLVAAQADSAAYIGAPGCWDGISQVSPQDGATDVPIDARALMTLDGDRCGGEPFDWVLSASGGDGGWTLVESGIGTAEPSKPTAIFFGADLAPETLYELAVSTDIEERIQTFTTGVDRAAAIDQAPVLTLPEGVSLVRSVNQDGAWSAWFDVTYQPDSHGLSLVTLYGVDSGLALTTLTATESGEYSWYRSGTTTLVDEICFEVGQIDGAGVEELVAEPVCVTPDVSWRDGSGCSAAGTIGLGWWAFGLLAVVPLRRRREDA